MRRFQLSVFNLILIVLFFQTNIFAQTVGQGSSQLGLAKGRPAGSYQISDIENINYFNGRVNITIPLAGVQGRGDVSLPVHASINSPGWRTFVEPIPDNNGNGGYSPGLFADYEPLGKVNRTLEVRVRMKVGYVDNTTCYGAPFYQQTLTRVYVVMPDGTEYELRDTLTDGQEMSMSIPAGCFTYPNRGRTFVSKDGSNLKFVADNDIRDDGVTDYPAGVLYFPNGQVISTNGFKDRNGNVTTFSSAVENGVIVYKNTDSIGRTTSTQPFYYDAYGPITGFVKYKGYAGGDRQYSIVGTMMSSALASGETIKTYMQLFPNLPNYGTGGYGFNPYVISEITLPNGKSYRFKYTSYGDLARIEFPTGSVVEYTWANGIDGAETSGQVYPGSVNDSFIYRRVVERRLYADGVNLTSKITISRPESLSGYTLTNAGYVDVKTYTPQLENFVRHYYHGQASLTISTPNTNFSYSRWKDGREYQTDTLSPLDSSLLRRTTQLWEQTSPGWWNCQGCTADSAPINNPHISETTTLLADSNQVSKKTFTYDSKNNLVDTYEYDYGNGTPGAFIRRTHTDYLTTNPVNNTDYTSNNLYILTLPSQSWISSDSAGNNKVSFTKFEYDNYSSDSRHAPLVPRSGVIGHDTTNYGTGFTTRGNLTKTTIYTNAASQTGEIVSSIKYDILGNAVETQDANSNIVTINYNDNFGSPDGEARTNSAPSQLNGLSTFAFATSQTTPFNFTAYTQFDYYLGAAVNSEDINGMISKTIYNDLFERPTQSVVAVGTAQERQTTIFYDDDNRQVQTTGDLNSLNDNLLKTISIYDKMGRTVETRNYEADGNYTAVQTQYDGLSRAYKVSNPFRPNEIDTSHPILWTTTKFDALGRTIEIETPDGAKSSTAYAGNAVLATDPAGKQRRSITDSTGQLVRIDEPDNNGNLGTVANPVQPVYYKYNTLGKMIEVTQGVQKRYFLYDSLGRLLRVRQPEQIANSALNMSSSETTNTQWTTGFSYDNNGNILTTTNAKNVTISSTYDALNRVLTKSYSDSVTPPVTFTYDDANTPYSKGRLTKVSSSISETRNTAFDSMGRLLSSQQATDGQTYTLSYKYNLAGLLTEQTYPSNRVVKTFVENNGNLSAISSKVWNGPLKTYAANFSYTASGVIKHLQIGNGLWESAKLNARQQVTELNMGTSPTDGSKWQVKYDYGEFDVNGNVDATKNSGNIARQTISFSGLAQPFVQTYKYDSLDRITEAKEKNNGNQTWIQTFGYDRYGNRTSFSQNILGQQLTINNLTLPQIDANTNRFQTGQGYQYDYNGNLIQEATGMQSTFDGENKQTEVRNASNVLVGRYFYDGNGKRVKKIEYDQYGAEKEIIIFVYDGMDKLVAEYSTAAPPQNPTTNYTATDPLGSPRVITDKQGQIVSRRDFMPFGEQLMPDATYRQTNLKYNSGDNIRQKFTGYQRDEETGLDFAEARYYNNRHGRFTAVDPLLASGKSVNPQTFNRYVYTMNRPLILIDSTGLQAGKPASPQQVKKPEQNQLPKVTVTVPDTDVYINKEVGDGQGGKKYFSGFGSIITIKVTDANGKPLEGATISESNKRKEGTGTITENKGTLAVDKNGEIQDIVGKGDLTDKVQPGISEQDIPDIKDMVNNNAITSTTEQTLTIKTSDGAVYQAVYDRTLTNVGSDGNPSTSRNANGINLTVKTTTPQVTVVKPPDPVKTPEPKKTNQ